MGAADVIAVDMPGSALSIAYTNYLQDSANRRFLTQSTARATAINDVIAWLGVEAGAGDDGYFHPDGADFDSPLCVNRITASAVGPDRWLVTVEYVVSKFTGFPSDIVTLCNAKTSYEAVQVWCAPDSFQDGLPYANNGRGFLYPGPPAGFSTDPSAPPTPYIFNRPVLNIQEPFTTTTNPMVTALGNVGRVYDPATISGISITTWGSGNIRFDGCDLTSTSSSGGGFGAVRFSGTNSWTISPGGFHQQKLTWDAATESWVCINVQAHPG